jgi:hypothetical protein
MTHIVEVHTRSTHTPEGPVGVDPVLLQVAEERITVAELIQRTVAEQIRVLSAAKKLNAQQAYEILDRAYLSPAEIARQARRGKVQMPRQPEPAAHIDVERQVKRAIEAFRARSFMIVSAGRQFSELDEELTLSEQNQVAFIKLTPLVGG